MTSVAVVIPVKDGERFLEQVLAAVLAQAPEEVLVVDSGSRDRSREIVRAAGVELSEVEPAEFGHGRTRNLAAELTSADAICFLTQDAVPVDGWLAAHREALALAGRVGASYGPHLARRDTSPMIARELEEFFDSMSPDGGPQVQAEGDTPFLSNVNACYLRECWEEIRFGDVAYSEDQAFGRAMLAAGWKKVFHPGAAVEHAHDYGVGDFARRYFDEYRGLRAATGHVEPLRPLQSARDVGARVKRDRAWMRDRGWPAGSQTLWTGRSAVHHASRRVFAALGSRAGSLPAPLERRLSLEGTHGAGQTVEAPPEPMGRVVSPAKPEPRFVHVLRVSRDGVAPLAEAVPGMSERRRLHIAVAVPAFRRGSGGHSTIFQLVRRLEDLGHTCSIWVHDAVRGDSGGRPAMTRRQIVDWFAPVRSPVFWGFDDWHGADVAVATGWETVYPLATMPGCRARAYLVNDHEPEFFATSAQGMFAERTYGMGFFPISASTWLRDLLRERYGCDGTAFRLGVDHDVYRPLPVERLRETLLFYARAATPRRAVPLGLLALEELRSRRPQVRVVTFGETGGMGASFAHEELGIATPGQLAQAYNEGTVGLCLSLTNYSLIPQEMMACGMPCVDVSGASSEAVFGADGPAELAAPDPLSLAAALEALLDDEDRWKRRSEAGLAFVADASWETAARDVCEGLREALRLRERDAAGHPSQP